MNKFGLSRDIPKPIQRKVRQKCGFGCVVCGTAIYEYHHYNPPFSQAKAHASDGITLLCDSCHGNEKRGRLSEETIKKAIDNPKCLQQGFHNHGFNVESGSLSVIWGSTTFIGVQRILEIYGKDFLSVDLPEEVGSPLRINALFYDKSGNEAARIIQNEWQGYSTNWDIETKQNRTIIRYEHRKIALIIRTEPPHRLVIEHLDMFCNGYRVLTEKGGRTSIFSPDGTPLINFSGATVSGCECAFRLE